MAKKQHNELAVGLTVLVVLSLSIYLVIMLADWDSITAPSKEISVKVPYRAGIRGLTKGSPVHLGGIKVGTITEVKVGHQYRDKTYEDIYAFFSMKMPAEYEMKTDCILTPQSGVLGGQSILSIKDLGSKGNVIEDGQIVELALADCVMDALKREFNPDNPEGFFAIFTKDVRDITDKIKDSLETVENTLVQINATFQTAESAIKDLQGLMGDERIDVILSNVTEVSTNLKLTTQEVRRAPWKLLYKPKENEYKIQALVDSAGAFASGAERLDNTAMRLNKLVSSENKSDIDTKEVEAMIAELQTSFENFQRAEKKFWNELK